MLTLRLTQTTIGDDQYKIYLSLEEEGKATRRAESDFPFRLTNQEQRDLRWYLEDFLAAHHDAPADAMAARIEKHMDEIGVGLFNAAFRQNENAQSLWGNLRHRLDGARVEIVSEVQETTSIPWELIRDPETDVPLALRARSFAHSYAGVPQSPKLPDGDTGPIRILLAICRPGGRNDVSFRSVAMRLIRGLNVDTRAAFQLDVLRPPTFDRLGRVLREASNEGQPYHIVHFDGHGTFLDLKKLFDQWETKTEEEIKELEKQLADFQRERFSPQTIYPRQPRHGRHGYLCFENPAAGNNLRLVGGQELGSLLVETGVGVLVLNA